MSYRGVAPFPNDSPQAIHGSDEFHAFIPSGHMPAAQQENNTPDNGHENGISGTPEEANKDVQKPAKESKTRLRKACDSCSKRKVKCDETGPPCRACALLDIPCTFERTSRRRGPPNRHAQAIKKRQNDSPETSSNSLSNLPTNASQSPYIQEQPHSADDILPYTIIYPLVKDYFIYIYPSTPIPHEPSFRAALEYREDRSNPIFRALLASMIGCLVALFPEKLKMHFREENMEGMCQSVANIIDRCNKIAIKSCGLHYVDKVFTVHEAMISYLQGLICAFTSNTRPCLVYFGQCLTIIRTLGLHKAEDSNHGGSGQWPSDGRARPEPEQDMILQELGKRTFWILFRAVRSLHQAGVSQVDICIPPATFAEPYPPLPLEIDDLYIESSHIRPQPPKLISMITGFNQQIKLYTTYDQLVAHELVHGADQLFDWNYQKFLIEEALKNVEKVSENLSLELTLESKFRMQNEQDLRLVALLQLDVIGGSDVEPGDPEDRGVQLEIQKIQFYTHQLGTRTYLVEKFWGFHDLHWRQESATFSEPPCSSPTYHPALPDDCKVMVDKREAIVKDLFFLLNAITPMDMALNGARFINQIRQIAQPLLLAPAARKGPYATRAEPYIASILDVLADLECLSAATAAAAAAAEHDRDGGDGGDDAEKATATMMKEEREDGLREGYWKTLDRIRTERAQSGGNRA